MKTILIVDCESQYTQLIARCVRNLNVYCQIVHCSKLDYTREENIVGIIFSGSWHSVHDKDAPRIRWEELDDVPVLTICYSAQSLASHYGANIISCSDDSEFGKTSINLNNPSLPLWNSICETTDVWMSHSDIISVNNDKIRVIATNQQGETSAFMVNNKIGLLFHPEVHHTKKGKEILHNFLDMCKCDYDWTPENYIENTVGRIRNQIKSDRVIMAVSGGVDSTVAATLMNHAIGEQLHCVFINNGLLRSNEAVEVMESFRQCNLEVEYIDDSQIFLSLLEGVTDPEEKRMIIGKQFIDSFVSCSKHLKGIGWLGQGTIYPDIIESCDGPRKIKSHHNVGGLPDYLPYKLIEPLRELFKDEVREVGLKLNIPSNLIRRHPFPGPGLAIRILSDVTANKVEVLQKADRIYIDILKRSDLYDDIWQAGAILLPVKSVGVMGDCRTYQYTIALRAVCSVDGMTASVFPIPHGVLSYISTQIINQVKGINRVVFDISSKPPSTIEWE